MSDSKQTSSEPVFLNNYMDRKTLEAERKKAARQHKKARDIKCVANTLTVGAYGVVGAGLMLNNIDIFVLGMKCVGYTLGTNMGLSLWQNKGLPIQTNLDFAFGGRMGNQARQEKNKAETLKQWIQDNSASVSAAQEESCDLQTGAPVTIIHPGTDFQPQ